ncbi:MAG: phage late control D family protein [Lachnospiraceae bacterium]|jgi:hypothetical protein|nr:phage late control D family protein [Lachnospiraceae bacterium]
MRDYQIKVEPFSYIALRELTVEKQTGEHARAIVRIHIADDKKDEYKNRLIGQAEQWVKIAVTGEKGEQRTIFHGVVKGFGFKVRQHETELWLELVSGTFLWDIQHHFRVYQDRSLTALAVGNFLSGGYAGSQLFAVSQSMPELGHVVIQYRETDWELVKRLASEHNQVLVPESWKQGSKYWIGMPEGRRQTIEEGTVPEVIEDIGAYQRVACNGLAGLQLHDTLELTYETREIYEMGDWIEYEGRRYYLHKLSSRYSGGELVHHYYFKTMAGLVNRTIKNDRQRGCAFMATVAEVDKDKVRIDVIGDESGRSERHWFTYETVYSSPDGTGWYCMPEVGDRVRLYVPGDEADSYVISSVHLESSSDRQNPDYKSLKTKYGKEVLFTPDRLIMTNNKGMMIELSDGSGIKIISDKDIVMQAEQNMTIASQGASLLLAAQEHLQLKQGDGTTMTLKEDIAFTGGEFRMQ